MLVGIDRIKIIHLHEGETTQRGRALFQQQLFGTADKVLGRFAGGQRDHPVRVLPNPFQKPFCGEQAKFREVIDDDVWNAASLVGVAGAGEVFGFNS